MNTSEKATQLKFYTYILRVQYYCGAILLDLRVCTLLEKEVG